MNREMQRHFERLLQTRRTELLEIDESGKAAAATVELDQARVGRLSRMDALQQQAMAAATDRRRGLELKRIAAALRRIEAGAFGRCCECDEEIASARLEVDPAATLCIGCAETKTG